MTALAILTAALQSIPAPIRRAILITWALAVVAAGALRIAEIGTGPLEAILLYIGGYLGVQSAVNVENE